MAKREGRITPRAQRPARIAVQGIRARVGNVEGSLANISVTGALLRARVALPVGHEGGLDIELGPKPATTQIRVARCEPIDVALPGAVWRRPEYGLGVAFVRPSAEFLRAVKQLTKDISGVEQSAPRVLVLGEEDDAISKMIDEALTEADYMPRVLSQARYVISTAKRIGAKAVIVSLQIDPDFSARAVLDALRGDPATAQLPVIVCARQAWLQPSHRTYLSEKRLRLLLVPFTPEELVLTLDRAISKGR